MWPFKKKREWIYDSMSFSESAVLMNRRIHEWLNTHQQYEPVDIAIVPSGITGILFGVIIYKYEVK